MNRPGTALAILPLLAGLWPGCLWAAFVVPSNWWGDLEYTYRQSRPEGGSRAVSNEMRGNIGTSAYIWQPWFITGDMRLTGIHEKRNSGSAETTRNSVTGALNLNVLPLSRIPLTLSYSVTDNRVGTDVPGALDQRVRQRHFRLTQGFLGRLYRLQALYDRLTTEWESLGSTTDTTYGLDYFMRRRSQDLRAEARWETHELRDSPSTTDTFTLTADHKYYPYERFNLSTSFTHLKDENHSQATYPVQGAAGQTLVTEFNQLSSTASWRDTTQRLLVNGALRYLEIGSGVDEDISTSRSLMASIQNSYAVTQHLRVNAGAALNVQEAGDGARTQSNTEQLGLYYNSRQYALGSFDYSWNTSGNLTRQAQEDEETTTSKTVNIGHGVNRYWQIARGTSLSLGLTQSIADTYTSTESGYSRQLAHTATLGLSRRDASAQSMAQLSLADSRGIGREKSHSQIGNLQLSRTQNLNRRSTLGGNVTFQASRREEEDTPDRGIDRNTNGSVNYQYTRPFGLQQVRFTSEIRFADSTPAEGDSRSEMYWDNRLQHHIGKLDSTLSLQLADRDGTRNALLLFQVRRTF